MNQQALSSFIWSVADLLRGDYKQSEYGKVILPLTVLRRLDCVLEDSKSAVLAEFEKRKLAGVKLYENVTNKKDVLRKTRDLLLSMLISGQLNVEIIETGELEGATA